MAEKRRIVVGTTIYNVFIDEERRNSFKVSITKRGINIRVPKGLKKVEKEPQIQEFLDWAITKIKANPPKKQKQKIYTHNDLVRTHSRIYKLDIQVRPSEKNFAKISNNLIILKIADHHGETIKQKYISKQLQKLLKHNHSQELHERVHHINKLHFGKELGKISYRHTISRWGVCKMDKKEIELSTKLLLAPQVVLDYVILHELAHLIEPNHSKRFWNVVKSVDPHYKKKIKWLKVNGEKLVI
ncbi:M48 family metallopeptidase [archaeon]|jgi:predicted metal-dependent hydrolase|nr:M48 family metallopeptidase [archaeon]MBT6182336.1 M48 family metallopeptidase [archaeon]MBT6606682.1 M48 family metallopeptidase [archaeon]MBT7251925.1 M48 family metallopeptidase [archaeon]MBT7660604.1 M48 family metallopeptidase [archaeon]